MLRRSPVVLAASLLVLSTGCGSTAAEAYRSHLPIPAPAASGTDLSITGAGFEVQAAGDPSKVAPDDAWKGVLATLNRYLEAGVLRPLRSGGPAADLRPLLGADAAAKVMPPGPDRAAFVDEGLPPATRIRRDAAVATLGALAGSDGAVRVVTAQLDLRLRADVEGAPLTIARTADLVLMPDGDTWKIDAYDIRVSRDSTGGRTTTTAKSP